jgi:hypothetical protein
MSAAANTLILVNLALEAATRAAAYNAAVAKAVAEGRDVTDEEVADARAKAVAAIDALDAPAGTTPA